MDKQYIVIFNLDKKDKTCKNFFLDRRKLFIEKTRIGLMQKEEVLVLHLVLFHIKKILEDAGIANGHFRAYESLGISPVQVNRSKSEHKEAVLLLCKGISEIFKTGYPEKLVQNQKLKESLQVSEFIVQ